VAAKFDALVSWRGCDCADSVSGPGWHVVLVEQPREARKQAQANAPMRATAGHAVYEGAGMAAPDRESARRRWGDATDGEQAGCVAESGDAFAQGNVKATWLDSGGAGTRGLLVGTGRKACLWAGRDRRTRLPRRRN